MIGFLCVKVLGTTFLSTPPPFLKGRRKSPVPGGNCGVGTGRDLPLRISLANSPLTP